MNLNNQSSINDEIISENLLISVEEIHTADDELANKYDGQGGDTPDSNPDRP